MGLVPITGQPVNMITEFERQYPCPPDDDFCILYKRGEDTMRAQMIQEPCGVDRICNGVFAPSGSSDLVTNGDFATSDGTGWSVIQGSWSYGTEAACTTNNIAVLRQVLTGLVDGANYTVTITVTNITDGAVQVSLGGDLAALIYTAGTYTFSLSPSGGNQRLEITSNNNKGTFCVDDISVILNGSTCWETDGAFDFTALGAKAKVGYSGYVKQEIITTDIAGLYYLIEFTISGVSAGTLSVELGGTVVATITQNGTYSFYSFSPQIDGYLSFVKDDDFDGTINGVHFYDMLNINQLSFKLVDANDLSIISDVNLTIGNPDATDEYGGSHIVNGNYITITLDTSEVDEGCYRLKAFDPCGENTNPEIVPDDVFQLANWSEISGGDITFVGGGALYTENGGNEATIQLNDVPALTSECNYEISVTVGNIDASLLPATISLTFGGVGAFTIDQPNQTYSVVVPFDNSFSITLSIGTPVTAANGDTLEIISISVKTFGLCELLVSDSPYISNCLRFSDNVGDAKLLEGRSDESLSLGFFFFDRFYLSLRHFISFVKVSYPSKKDTTLSSAGRKKIHYAQKDRTWDLLIEAGDHNLHDAVSTMLDCDQFYIGESTTNKTEYISEEKNYQPDWGFKQASALAECTIEVSRAKGVSFNLNR